MNSHVGLHDDFGFLDIDWNERWMEVTWWPGLCVGRRVFFAIDARYFSPVVLHFVWCCYHGDHGALAFRFETLTRKIFNFQVNFLYFDGVWPSVWECNWEYFIRHFIEEVINDFSFDCFLSSVVEIRCHSRYCNYVTQLLFKGALSRYFGLL